MFYYKKACVSAPAPSGLVIYGAFSYTAMGQYEEAIRILKRIAEKQPDQLYAHTMLRWHTC